MEFVVFIHLLFILPLMILWIFLIFPTLLCRLSVLLKVLFALTGWILAWLHFLWDGRAIEKQFSMAVESLTFSEMLYVLLIAIFFTVGLLFFPLLPLPVPIIFLLSYCCDLLLVSFSKHIYISHLNRMLSKGDPAT